MDNDSPELSRSELDTTSSEENDLELGQPSTIETEAALQSMGAGFAQTFLKQQPNGVAYLNIETIQKLAKMIEAEIPFFFQGAGISTIPKQLEHYERLKPELASGGPDIEKEFKSGIDCKLPTAVLGFVIRELAKMNGQDTSLYFLTKRQSPHASLVVVFNNEEKEQSQVQIDYENKFASTPPKTGPRDILMPNVTREYTYSYSIVKQLAPEQYGAYQQTPYILHPINALGLKQIDEYFIKS